MAGISMTIFYLLQFGINYFTLDNVSKEYTLKKDVSVVAANENSDPIEKNCMEYANDKTPLITKSNDRLSFNQKYITSLGAIFKNRHIVFCLAMAVVQNYARGLIKIVAPIKAEEYLNWKQADVAKFIVITMAVGKIPTMILISIITKFVNDYFLYLSSFIVLILSLLLMELLPMFKYDLKCIEIILYFEFSLNLGSGSIFYIMSRAMLIKFVPENIQSITQGFRNALFEMAILLSGLCVRLPVMYLSQTMFAMLVIVCVSLAWYIAEEHSYRDYCKKICK